MPLINGFVDGKGDGSSATIIPPLERQLEFPSVSLCPVGRAKRKEAAFGRLEFRPPHRSRSASGPLSDSLSGLPFTPPTGPP